MCLKPSSPCRTSEALEFAPKSTASMATAAMTDCRKNSSISYSISRQDNPQDHLPDCSLCDVVAAPRKHKLASTRPPIIPGCGQPFAMPQPAHHHGFHNAALALVQSPFGAAELGACNWPAPGWSQLQSRAEQSAVADSCWDQQMQHIFSMSLANLGFENIMKAASLVVFSMRVPPLPSPPPANKTRSKPSMQGCCCVCLQ